MDIFVACEAGNVEELKKCIQSGADVNRLDHAQDYAPIHYAILGRNQNITCLKILIEAGADVNKPTEKDGETSLCFANIKATQILLEAGANVDLQARDGNSPLHFSVDDPEKTKLLLEAGANPNIQNIYGRTPLHEAKLMLETTKHLLDAGANPNIADGFGNTPLHFAAKKADLPQDIYSEYFQTMMDSGADPSLMDIENQRPEDLTSNKFASAQLRDHRIAQEQKALREVPMPENLPGRFTPRISRGRL